MSYYLAIDAGGTHTRALLADDQRVLAHASTGSVKLMRVPEAEATAQLGSLLDELAASANVSLTRIDRTCIGLAGLTIPAVRAWATEAIAARVSGSVLLLGDEEIALEAAFPGVPGILVIAGTGSNVIGRAADGTLHRAGGWGPILGDEGAGYWVGLEALRAALRNLDTARETGVPSLASETCDEAPSLPEPGASSIAASSRWVGTSHATQMLHEIQRHWNLNSLAELIALGNHRGDAARPAPDFADLAPLVARLAQPDPQSAWLANPIALAILHRAGEALANLITVVAHKINVHSTPDRSNLELKTPSLPVAFTGSVLTHIAPVREAMIGRLAITLPAASVQPSAIDPLEGALRRARLS